MHGFSISSIKWRLNIPQLLGIFSRITTLGSFYKGICAKSASTVADICSGDACIGAVDAKSACAGASNCFGNTCTGSANSKNACIKVYCVVVISIEGISVMSTCVWWVSTESIDAKVAKCVDVGSSRVGVPCTRSICSTSIRFFALWVFVIYQIFCSVMFLINEQ